MRPKTTITPSAAMLVGASAVALAMGLGLRAPARAEDWKPVGMFGQHSVDKGAESFRSQDEVS